MFIVLNEFHVKEEHIPAFETEFGSAGTRSETLQKGEGFMSTELMKDGANKRRFITIDRWISKDAYEDFQIEFENESAEVAKLGENMLEKQQLIGAFERAR